MTLRRMTATPEKNLPLPLLYDRYLLLALIGLIAIGLLTLTSASIVISHRLYGSAFHFLLRQGIFLSLGIVLAIVTLKIEIRLWEKYSGILLVLNLLLLTVVLMPGIGHQVNGSTRWISIGPVGIQVSELAKLTIILYLAGYLVRQEKQVRNQLSGFIKPLLILAIVVVLLLKEPDFGSAAVICATALGMLFLAGVRLWQFTILLITVSTGLGIIAISSPYRLERLTTFLNPWANQFDSGYQLTQSLIAFGRGGWLGVGLGESVQKLFYLPEAHTDFLFAVLAEELGLAGILFVMSLFTLFVSRAFLIARRAHLLGNLYAGYLAYGLSLWFSLQIMINIGVNAGVLPTKGLTLPFMSYGGASMLISCIAAALLFRIDYESRKSGFSFISHSSRIRGVS